MRHGAARIPVAVRPEAPATPHPNGTVLSDLSANVFAALLLILVVLLQLRLAADRAPPAPVRPIDATADLGAVTRRPLAPGTLLTLLRRRVLDTPGLAIDVGRSGLTLVENGQAATRAGPAALDGLATGPSRPGGAIRLYVFSNRLFGDVAHRLERAGLPFEEVSVPQALRDPTDPGRWSPAFLALRDVAGSPDGFREGLTRLLVASDARLAPDGRASGGSDPAAGADGGATSLGASALQWLGAALAICALLAAAAVVAVTEGLVGGSGVGYAPGGRSAAEDLSDGGA